MNIGPLSYVATIMLACESFVLLLIPAAIILGGGLGVRWLRRKLPPLFAQARKYVAIGKAYVERGCAAVVAPLIAAHAFAARARVWMSALAGLFQGEH